MPKCRYTVLPPRFPLVYPFRSLLCLCPSFSAFKIWFISTCPVLMKGHHLTLSLLCFLFWISEVVMFVHIYLQHFGMQQWSCNIQTWGCGWQTIFMPHNRQFNYENNFIKLPFDKFKMQLTGTCHLWREQCLHEHDSWLALVGCWSWKML